MTKIDVRKISYGLIKILYRSFIAAKKCCALMIRFICKSILPNLIPFLYDKLCIKYLWEIFHPPAINSIKKPPSRLLIMALVVYTSFYGFASIRYEQAISRLENRVNNIYYQSEGAGWKTFFSKIPEVQNTKIPHRPMLSDPISVFYSLWPSKDVLDADVIRDLQDLLNSKKSNLNDMVLEKFILSEVDVVDGELQMHKANYNALGVRDFTKSSFTNSWLKEAIFSNMNLQFTKFDKAFMISAQFNDCNLASSSFISTNLVMANLKKSNLSKADFRDAFLLDADLRGAILIGANLYNTHDLDTAKLQGVLYNSIGNSLFENIKCIEELREIFRISHIRVNINEAEDMINNACAVGLHPTIFPDGFNPKKHGMLDASDAKDLEQYIEMQAKNQAHKFTDN